MRGGRWPGRAKISFPRLGWKLRPADSGHQLSRTEDQWHEPRVCWGALTDFGHGTQRINAARTAGAAGDGLISVGVSHICCRHGSAVNAGLCRMVRRASRSPGAVEDCRADCPLRTGIAGRCEVGGRWRARGACRFRSGLSPLFRAARGSADRPAGRWRQVEPAAGHRQGKGYGGPDRLSCPSSTRPRRLV